MSRSLYTGRLAGLVLLATVAIVGKNVIRMAVEKKKDNYSPAALVEVLEEQAQPDASTKEAWSITDPEGADKRFMRECDIWHIEDDDAGIYATVVSYAGMTHDGVDVPPAMIFTTKDLSVIDSSLDGINRDRSGGIDDILAYEGSQKFAGKVGGMSINNLERVNKAYDSQRKKIIDYLHKKR